jgi:DNA polymerase I
MADRKRLFLLDATAMIYRSYFAFIRNPLVTKRGEQTSASFGFVAALLKIIREEQPDYIAAVFDSAKPTFRHEQYAEYKATREKMPDDLAAQLERVDEVVESLSLPNIRLDRYEADDLIGTLAVKGVEAGLDVVVVSGDKDLMQLVNENVCMITPGKVRDGWEKIEQDGVVGKWGVPSDRITDLLGLMGDTSDNIPGVPKVGPKTAAELITEYGDLESVLEAAPSVKKKVVSANLQEFADQARLSKDLATIVLDAPIDLDLDMYEWTGPRLDLIRPLFIEMEFFQFLEEMDPEGEQAADIVEANYETVTTQNLPELARKLREAGRFAIDTETTSIDSMKAELIGISIAHDGETGYYIPIGHGRLQATDVDELLDENVPFDLVREHIGTLLEDPEIIKIAQNFKYDLVVLERAGFRMDGPLFDTMIASYLIDPAGRHNLDTLAQQHLGHTMIPISELIGKGKQQGSFAHVSIDKATEYSGEDALVTYKLAGLFEPQIESMELTSLLHDIEMPLMHVLIAMERNGIRVDRDMLAQLSEEIRSDIERLESEIYDAAGETFNINSTQQLGTILFEKMQLPTQKKTKTGYSTDQDTLETLASKTNHPLPKFMLDYRHLTKLLGTYIDTLPELLDPDTQRVHTSFNQTVASTGRLSSSDPNLQNIPVRTELGGRIRAAFVPQPGWGMMSADYSQVELRVLAHISGDERLREAFRNDEDIHAATASAVFDLAPAFITADERRQAKAINFGVIYGQTAFGLSQALGIPRGEAQKFITSYFETYSGVAAYRDRVIEEAVSNGYVSTMLGRRREIPELGMKDRNRRNFGERLAINMPIQGTAADMIKIAMININRRLDTDGFDANMLLQVHDELVFEAPPDEMDALSDLVRDEMSSAIVLDVPIKVDIGVGANWQEIH